LRTVKMEALKGRRMRSCLNKLHENESMNTVSNYGNKFRHLVLVSAGWFRRIVLGF
jgi:hypothetical protein